MTPADTEQLKVRPVLRILGAFFMLAIAVLMAVNSIPFFSAKTVLLPSCAVERKASSRFLCKVEKALRSMLSPHMQGLVEALLHLFIALMLAYLSWLLIKPLMKHGIDEST